MMPKTPDELRDLYRNVQRELSDEDFDFVYYPLYARMTRFALVLSLAFLLTRLYEHAYSPAPLPLFLSIALMFFFMPFVDGLLSLFGMKYGKQISFSDPFYRALRRHVSKNAQNYED